MIPEKISRGLFAELALNRFLQFVNRAVDGWSDGALSIRDDYWLVAVAAGLDHATFVVMAGLMAYDIAKVDIDASDTVAVAIQRTNDHSFNLSGRLFAAFDVAVCSDLDLHCRLHLYVAWRVEPLFDPAPHEVALVRRILSYIRSLALLRQV